MPRGVWNRPRTKGLPPRRTTTPRNWTREQMDLLEDQYGRVPNEVLAKRLGRTVWAMRLKAVKMGVLPWKYQQLSKNEVLEILGQTGDGRMTVWLELGWLPRKRVPGRGQGGFRYVFEEADVVAFLEEHDEQVDRRRIDVAYRRHARQWLTTGEVFRRGGPDPNLIDRAAEELGIALGARGERRVLFEADLLALIEWRRRRVDDIEHRRRLVRRERLWRRNRTVLAQQRIAS